MSWKRRSRSHDKGAKSGADPPKPVVANEPGFAEHENRTDRVIPIIELAINP